jgi:hypothetical protein
MPGLYVRRSKLGVGLDCCCLSAASSLFVFCRAKREYSIKSDARLQKPSDKYSLDPVAYPDESSREVVVVCFLRAVLGVVLNPDPRWSSHLWSVMEMELGQCDELVPAIEGLAEEGPCAGVVGSRHVEG